MIALVVLYIIVLMFGLLRVSIRIYYDYVGESLPEEGRFKKEGVNSGGIRGIISGNRAQIDRYFMQDSMQKTLCIIDV